MWGDLESFVVARKWSDAGAIVDAVGEQGYELDALRMHQFLNAAQGDFVFEPYQHPKPPVIESWWQEKDVKRSESEYATEWDDDGRLTTFKKS